MGIAPLPVSRWRKRLEKELAFRQEFERLSVESWKAILSMRSITSTNHDTVLSLDWPHYCVNATVACGGAQGWCYTFQGKQASMLHNRHAAMVDVLASQEPMLFAEVVEVEVRRAVKQGRLPYPNLRFSGSGEVIDAYLPGLQEIARRGVRLWGFTRNVRLAKSLRASGASVIVSCDKTSPRESLEHARREGFPIAYSSSGIEDRPPAGTLVTFPVHRIGRVHEVVDADTLCPKVLADYFEDSRPDGYCQRFCRRCHLEGPTA